MRFMGGSMSGGAGPDQGWKRTAAAFVANPFDRFELPSDRFGWVYRYRNADPLPVAPITTASVEVAVQLEGDWEVAVWGEPSRRYGPGDVFVVPALVRHRYAFRARGATGCQVGFALPGVVDGRRLAPWPLCAPWRRRFLELARDLAGPGDVHATLDAFAADAPVAELDSVERARVLLAETSARPLYLEQVADEVGLHPKTLSRRFRERTGVTPIRFRTELRLQRAIRLLWSRPELAVAAVAARVGIDDPPVLPPARGRHLRDDPGYSAVGDGSTARRYPLRRGPMRELSDLALDLARDAGATFADLRAVEERRQEIGVERLSIKRCTDQERFGYAVRVLLDGAWGFATGTRLERDEVARVTRAALATARASGRVPKASAAVMAPAPAAVETRTGPCAEDPFAVPPSKGGPVAGGEPEMLGVAGVVSTFGFVHVTRIRRVLANTDGSYLDLTNTFVEPMLMATAAVDGESQTRSYPRGGRQAGWEWMRASTCRGTLLVGDTRR